MKSILVMCASASAVSVPPAPRLRQLFLLKLLLKFGALNFKQRFVTSIVDLIVSVGDKTHHQAVYFDDFAQMSKRKLTSAPSSFACCPESAGDSTVAVIALCDVPVYLQTGELFQSMMQLESSVENEGEEADRIAVPVQFIKSDQSVSSVDDAWSLLYSLRYWITGTDLPATLVAFCLSPGGKCIPIGFWETFASQFPRLNALRCMTTSCAADPIAKVRMAIATGDVRLFRLVHEILQCLPATACLDAVRSRSVACLQYAHERGVRNLAQKLVNAAIYMDATECLEFAVNQGYVIPRGACVLAAEQGRLRCLQYLFAARTGAVAWDSGVCDAAAGAGQLDCLKFAVEVGKLVWETDTINRTAENGHVACLAYLHERGAVWDESTCAAAAAKGQLACLEYLHEHGCPWDSYTCADAAEIGSLCCLQYAHEHGCPWNERTCTVAATFGQLDCLEYALEHGCACDLEAIAEVKEMEDDDAVFWPVSWF